MKASRILVAVLVLLGIGGAAYMLKNREKTFAGEAQKEVQTQAAEIQQCKANLATIQKAWADYKRDHKGGEPRSADLMKYVKDPNVFVCPTELRWAKLGRPMQSGTFTVDRKQYKQTYGFLWSSAGGGRDFKKYGDKAVLAKCTTHAEALYRAGYRRNMPPDAFAEENRPKLISEVAGAKDLVVLRNGTIEERPAGSD